MNLQQAAGAVVVAILCAGCQSTSIRSAWFDTDFTGPPMQRIVVYAEAGTTADSRAVEDMLAARLRAAGVDGVTGTSLRLDDPALTDEGFTRGVVDSGAQGLLLVRLLGVDTRTQIATTLAPGGMAWGRGTWGGTSRHRTVTQVVQYDIATVETKLFDVSSRRVVWAATTSTLNPRSVVQELPAFTDLIVGQLRDRQIVGPK